MIEPLVSYWRTGGLLMPVLACISYGIWFFYLRLRSQALGMIRVPDAFREDHVESIGRDLLLMSALTAAAPLIGLLGTVIGMVTTFDAVSSSAGRAGDEVAAGRVQRLMAHARVRMRECAIGLNVRLEPLASEHVAI
jgi:hypothetical protein